MSDEKKQSEELGLEQNFARLEQTLELLESDGALTFNEYPRSDTWQLRKRAQINAAIKENLQ